MSDPAVQKGTTLKISFGSLAYTGYIAQSAEWEKLVNDEEIIKDENGATVTKVHMDPSDRYSFEFVIKDVGGSITPPRKGDTIALTDMAGTSISAMCESARVSHAPGATKLSLEIVKETSMTYS